MHSRHRSPGNGYNRSSSMGMGLAASSRISPSADASLRGHSLYANSGYRSFNRGGLGRSHNAHTKSFQPLPTPTPQVPQKYDIFVEAGRLAAEYLVSQGLLHPTVLSSAPKWQNANSSNNSVGFKSDFRSQPQDVDNLQNPQEGRASAISRLGNAVSDSSSGRRRFNGDDFGHSGFRAHLKGRRRSGSSYRGYGLDSSRDYASRSSSFSDRTNTNSRVSPENDNKGEDDDFVSRQQEEQVRSKDVGNGEQKSKTEDADKLESDMDVIMGSKSSSSGSEKDSLQETEDKEAAKSSDDLTNLKNAGTEDVKDKDCPSSAFVDEIEKPTVIEELSISDKAVEGDGNNATDLVSLCKFSKVPTRIRSSLASKILKVDPPPITQAEESSGFAPQGKLELLNGDDSLGNSSSDMPMDKTDDSKRVESEIPKSQSVQSVDYVGELGPANILEQGDAAKSLSVSVTIFPCDSGLESSQGTFDFGSCNAMSDDRGDKRALDLEDSDKHVGAKKPRELLPSTVMEVDESFHLSNLGEKKVNPLEIVSSSCEKPIAASDHENVGVNDPEFSEVGDKQFVQFAQEKQLFPSSFKICDLNLMGVSEMHENHDGEPNLSYPALPVVKRESAPIDIDLSISNSIVPCENSQRKDDGKAIEVIDLETDCADEGDLIMVETKEDTVYNGLEGFPNHAQNTGVVSDVQDGYGLMISEFLGNDFPSCSSVPGDINSIPNDIGLHNGEATLGDDDSIYMSLGEIPLTFLRSWEQPPTQDSLKEEVERLGLFHHNLHYHLWNGDDPILPVPRFHHSACRFARILNRII